MALPLQAQNPWAGPRVLVARSLAEDVPWAEQAVKAALTRLRARGVEALVSPPSAAPPSERNNRKRAADA
ncbi:MAG: hypothetical protein MJD61_13960, partial [Proteobacteria bacterium]|nr:hypothetical protein [Pseudomonadota bacterium]